MIFKITSVISMPMIGSAIRRPRPTTAVVFAVVAVVIETVSVRVRPLDIARRRMAHGVRIAGVVFGISRSSTV